MKHSFARLSSVLALLVASLLLAAGCGGGGDDSESSSKGSSSSSEGKSLFEGTCGGCHTLTDAGTTGSVGPNLDDTKLDAAGIEAMIASGGGAMPPALLDGDKATAVAEYVAAQAAK